MKGSANASNSRLLCAVLRDPVSSLFGDAVIDADRHYSVDRSRFVVFFCAAGNFPAPVLVELHSEPCFEAGTRNGGQRRETADDLTTNPDRRFRGLGLRWRHPSITSNIEHDERRRTK